MLIDSLYSEYALVDGPRFSRTRDMSVNCNMLLIPMVSGDIALDTTRLL